MLLYRAKSLATWSDWSSCRQCCPAIWRRWVGPALVVGGSWVCGQERPRSHTPLSTEHARQPDAACSCV